jgi:hypothetical protein
MKTGIHGKRLAGFLLLCLCACAALAGESKPSTVSSEGRKSKSGGSGPFCFEAGMTLNKIKSLVGKKAITLLESGRISLDTAPCPHRDFESYVLTLSPKDGLLKINAIGKIIATHRNGREVEEAFNTIYDALIKKYGMGKKYDSLNSGSLLDKPEDWMMGLKKGERSLAAYWSDHLPNRITAISLKAKVISMDQGYLTLGYEFEGFDSYADAQEENVF